MRSGKLKSKVIIKRRTKNIDEYGQRKKEYEKVYAAKGNVRYLSGTDLIKAGVATNIEVITVLMRMDSRLKHEHYLFVDNHLFNITGKKPSDNKREVIVTAEREV